MSTIVNDITNTVLPNQFPLIWSNDWGEDHIGLWTAFSFKEVRLVFRWIPSGQFMMGSPVDEPERELNEHLHEVTLTEGLWLAETTCTQALWQAVMGHNPSHFKGSQRPVENVSWNDIQQFIQLLNQDTSHSDEWDELEIRLPTEAEWEYACRSGTQTPFSFGNYITTSQANFNGDDPYAYQTKGLYRGQTVNVKELPGNNWGLYQMHGNVWEWCDDCHTEYTDEPVTDPKGEDSSDTRILRGGGWVSSGRHMRCAHREWLNPGSRHINIGFRLARSPNGLLAGK
ncbi:MAG: formylglycine-generating enzyme family protein [Gammaproteobacteria bacterium]|nr:formylglycine-generating enzyme family protein [Gammaproteobacteria bacterium]